MEMQGGEDVDSTKLVSRGPGACLFNVNSLVCFVTFEGGFARPEWDTAM